MSKTAPFYDEIKIIAIQKIKWKPNLKIKADVWLLLQAPIFSKFVPDSFTKVVFVGEFQFLTVSQ